MFPKIMNMRLISFVLLFLKAGINKDNLAIALEPEAASIYCQYLSFAKENTSYPSLSDTKYMVVDLGGENSHDTL